MNLTNQELLILSDALRYKILDKGIKRTSDAEFTLLGKIKYASEGVDTEALAKKQLDNLL